MMFQQRARILIISLLALLGLLFAAPTPLYAQPILVEAFPFEDQVITFAPESLTLVFDRAISTEDLLVTVTNGAGESVVKSDPVVNLADIFRVETPLEPLPNGIYTVSYRVKTIGGAAAVRDEYSFTVQLPEPKLYLLEPIDGSSIFSDAVDLLMRIESVSFDYFETRIHIYLDGEMIDSIDQLDYHIEGLEPGVHEIKVLLAQFDQELFQTENIVRLVIAESSSEPAGDLPELGVTLTPTRWAVVIIVSLGIAAGGFILGRKMKSASVADDEKH